MTEPMPGYGPHTCRNEFVLSGALFTRLLGFPKTYSGRRLMSTVAVVLREVPNVGDLGYRAEPDVTLEGDVHVVRFRQRLLVPPMFTLTGFSIRLLAVADVMSLNVAQRSWR